MRLQRMLAVGVVVVAAAIVATQAGASAPSRIHVAGNYGGGDQSNSVTNCTPDGPYILHCATTGVNLNYYGDLQGSSVTDFTWTIDCKAGKMHAQGIETFTGSVAGVGSGTSTWAFNAHSGFDCTVFEFSHFSGTDVIVAGSGDLAGLRGSIQRADTTYDGELRY
jgi:hypothetical protein